MSLSLARRDTSSLLVPLFRRRTRFVKLTILVPRTRNNCNARLARFLPAFFRVFFDFVHGSSRVYESVSGFFFPPFYLICSFASIYSRFDTVFLSIYDLVVLLFSSQVRMGYLVRLEGFKFLLFFLFPRVCLDVFFFIVASDRGERMNERTNEWMNQSFFLFFSRRKL